MMNYIQYMKEPFQPIGFMVGVPTNRQASTGVLKIRLTGIASDKTPTKEELILQRKELARSLAKKENNIVTETDRQNAKIETNVENATTPSWLKGLKLAKNAANFGLGAGAFVGTIMTYPYFAAAGPGGLAAAGGLQGAALGMMGNALENLYGFNAGLTTGSAIKDAMLGATGEVVLGPMIGKGMSWVGNKTAPVWNAAKPYVIGLYNTTNYSSLGNRLAHPIESLRFAKINTKLSDLVKRAYPEETAKFMLEEASPLFKTVRYYNKGNSGPLYIGGTDVPLLIEGLRNTPTTTVKMWDRAHEYGHLFDDALRRLDVGMARGNFGLSKEGISLVPKNYTYSPGVGINTPRGQMEFMADNIASSLYPEPKHVGMLHGEVAPYLERLALAAQVPFGSMYVLNRRSHVPYFLPEYKNFGRFIPTSTQRGSLGKGYKLNAQDGHSILLDTEIKPQTIPTKTSLAFFERQPAKISKAERLGISKGIKYYTQEENLAFRNQINNFAKKYGYEPIGDEVTDPEVLERYAKSLIKRHNTFYRGVELNPKESNLSLEYMATHAPGGGAGELYITPYLSVAAMYGEPVEILRPYKLGADRTRWFDEGDFQIYTAGGRRDMHLWEDKKGIAAPWLRSEEFAGKESRVYKPHVETELTGRNLQFIPISVLYRNIHPHLLPVYRVGSLAVPNTPFYKSGGSIHIKKKNRGSFTRYCNGKVTKNV